MADVRETVADFGRGPQAEVRRWLMELTHADKREKDYRDQGKKIWDTYRGKSRRKNSFNILWSNTETLAPAVFNSPPQPNVRRRFKDADPVGKTVSTVLERCLEFQTDTEPFMSNLALDVLDMLLPGRGVSRIRYVPSLVKMEGAEPPADPMEGDQEELAWEQVVIEHVQWDDFRHGPGKTWAQVQWVGFRHRLTRDELVEKFGKEIGKAITLDEPDDDDLKKDTDADENFKTGEVWELWCMCDRKVRFISSSYKTAPLKVIDDPLKLNGFYPLPKPLYAVQDSASLEPIPLFEQYREQADELNRISTRINKLIDACKVRGIFDATLQNDIAQLMKAGDNELVPMQDAAAWVEKGGLEKAIFMMPVEDIAKTLAILYTQRDAAKQVVYEITGIADVMRGSTDPNETLGAQELKAQWGGQRVQALQREVQRYARDIIRLMGEVVAERFQPETLLRMTGLQIPTKEQLAMAAQQGQQPALDQPPPVTLDQVMKVLRDDATRMFKVDVETDSMIAATVDKDMQSMERLLTGITNFVSGIGPAVQAGAVPVEAVKETILAVTRRARLGSVVEDAFEKMKPPEPVQQPEDNTAKVAEVNAQRDQQLATIEAQRDIQKHQATEQAKVTEKLEMAARDDAREQRDAEREIRLAEIAAETKRHEATERRLTEIEKLASQERLAVLSAKTTIAAAQIGADSRAQAADKQAETSLKTAEMSVQASKEAAASKPEPKQDDGTAKALAVAIEGFTQTIQAVSRPRVSEIEKVGEGKYRKTEK